MKETGVYSQTRCDIFLEVKLCLCSLKFIYDGNDAECLPCTHHMEHRHIAEERDNILRMCSIASHGQPNYV